MVKRHGTEWRDDPYETLGSSKSSILYPSTKANIIIFSKDRAAQLDLLLRSMEKNIDQLYHQNVLVLFKASSPEFADGYRKLVSAWGRRDRNTGFVTWINEEAFGFRSGLINIFEFEERREAPITMFLVDDIVFTDEVSFRQKEVEHFLHDPEVLALSLRLDQHKTHCYATNTPMKAPTSQQKDLYLYSWFGTDGDFSYPMSVDGNLFRTEQILPLLKKLNYWNPNTLEAQLSQNPIQCPLMLAYDKSKLVNIPANRVQSTYLNRNAASFEPELLNELYLKGQQIDFEPFSKLETPSVHFEMPYQMSDTK